MGVQKGHGCINLPSGGYRQGGGGRFQKQTLSRNKYLSRSVLAMVLIIKCSRKQNQRENEIDVKIFLFSSRTARFSGVGAEVTSPWNFDFPSEFSLKIQMTSDLCCNIWTKSIHEHLKKSISVHFKLIKREETWLRLYYPSLATLRPSAPNLVVLFQRCRSGSSSL